MKNLILVFLIIISIPLRGKLLTYDKVLRNLRGKKNFDEKNYEKAETEFRNNALEYPQEGKLHYNLGNALYKNQEFEKAEDEYKLALQDKDFKQQSKIYQNLGNLNFKQKKYQDAIKNYRNALIKNPENEDARFNYELASKFLQRQQKQKQQSKQNKEKDKKNKEKQKQDNKQQDKQKEKQQQQQSQAQKKKEEKKKKETEQILKALIQKEKQKRKEEKKIKTSKKPKEGKYW